MDHIKYTDHSESFVVMTKNEDLLVSVDLSAITISLNQGDPACFQFLVPIADKASQEME